VNSEELKKRTKTFALHVIEAVKKFPRTMPGEIVGRQVVRSATSIGANYRSACRGRSPADFIAKLGIVEEEADESLYWLELAVDSQLITALEAAPLLKEADELTAIFAASRKTARKNKIQMNGFASCDCRFEILSL
jgi:four helix bundle protein